MVKGRLNKFSFGVPGIGIPVTSSRLNQAEWESLSSLMLAEEELGHGETGETESRGAALYSTLQSCGMLTMASVPSEVGCVVFGAAASDVHTMYFEARQVDALTSSARPTATTSSSRVAVCARSASRSTTVPALNFPSTNRAIYNEWGTDHERSCRHRSRSGRRYYRRRQWYRAGHGAPALTKSLAHDLLATDGRATAHLRNPGFTYIGFARRRGVEEKPDAARTSGQGTDFLLAGTASGDFHILYPDNDVDRATDERRMAPGATDIVENRPRCCAVALAAGVRGRVRRVREGIGP